MTARTKTFKRSCWVTINITQLAVSAWAEQGFSKESFEKGGGERCKKMPETGHS